MIVECPNCNKKFNLEENLIPDSGRDLKCSSCGNIWRYEINTDYKSKKSKLLNEPNKGIEIAKSKIENKEIETDEPEIDNKNILINDKDNEEQKKKINKKQPKSKKDKNLIVEDKKENEKTNKGIKTILVFFLIIIISLLGVILLADTFKLQILNLFPNLVPLFDSFYETLLDLKLFLIDLTN